MGSRVRRGTTSSRRLRVTGCGRGRRASARPSTSAACTVTDPDTGQPYVERDDEDGPAADPADIYVDPSLEPTAVKPKPKKPPTAGDKLNTGLFLVAVIVIASIFHRR
jgi:hypothetical protein